MLDCERRLIQFKDEFRALFEQQLQKENNNFEDHYQHVLGRMAQATIDDDQRRMNLFTQPETTLGTKHTKGTFIISEADVLSNPMLKLSEKEFKEMYGSKKLEVQNLKNLTQNDDFINNLFKQTLKENSR